jgi:uncharacterized membrane protein
MTVFPPEAGTPHAPADSGSRLAGQPDQRPGTDRRGVVVQRARQIIRAFPRPFAMLGLLLVSLALDAYRDGIGDPLALVVIVIGATPLVRHTIIAVREHRYALDYLALLAIAAALAAIEFQVGAVIALMLASGEALEDYGVRRARGSLSLLADRIPRHALVVGDADATVLLPVEEITIGSVVMVRHGEVLPLDGELLSTAFRKFVALCGGLGGRARHRRGGVLLAHIDHSFTHLGGGVNRTTSRKSCICSNAVAGDTGVSTPRRQSERSSVPSTRYSFPTISGRFSVKNAASHASSWS